MNLFVNPDKTRKSPIIMYGFLFALLFGGIFGLLYRFLVEPLYLYLKIPGNEALTTAIHCILIGLLGSAICCVFFVLKDKRIVPAGFTFLAVFLLIFYLTGLRMDAADRGMLLYVISLYALAPVLLGNALSWAIYLKLRGLSRKKLSSDTSAGRGGYSQ